MNNHIRELADKLPKHSLPPARCPKRINPAVITALAAVLGLAPGTGPAVRADSAEPSNPAPRPAGGPPTPGGLTEATPRADHPLADPVVQADAVFSAEKITAWREDDAHLLLTEGRFVFRLGAYGFRGDRAVIRIDTEHAPGRRIRHLAIYLDQARPLHGHGPVKAEAPRLLVTASTTGRVEFQTSLLRQQDAAPVDSLLRAAVERLQRHRQALARPTLPAPTQPLFGPEVDERRQARRRAIAERHVTRLVQQLPTGPPRSVVPPPTAAAPKAPKIPPPTTPPVPPQPAVAAAAVPTQTVLPSRGVVYLGAQRVTGSSNDHALLLIGEVRLIYDDKEHDRQMSLTAERVVIFTETNLADAIAGTPLGAADVQGVYLEDNVVISDGQFTVRAPRMYFDLTLNKAVLLDAVMYTFDMKHKVPLYLRADVVRQTSATSFEAENAQLTTSEFAEPHFAIRSDRLTIKRGPDEAGAMEVFTANNNTLQVGKVPVFWWPYLAGENRDVPIRRVAIHHSDQNGMQLETTWNLFALAGQTPPEGVELLERLDYLGEHGPATGAIVDYELESMFGRLDSYLVPIDDGTDEIGGRRDVEQNDATRGFVHWQHRHGLGEDWELSLEASHVSDETFLEEFFDGEATEAKEYETSLYLKKQDQERALTLLARYDLTDFTPQLTTLQAPGYSVDKLPELGYYRTGTSVWDDRLTWFTENRLSRMRLRFGDDTPADRGFSRIAAGQLFGIANRVSFDDDASTAGVGRDWRHRFDSRHEIAAPLKASIFDLVPYAAGRVTAYDEGFESFSGKDDDPFRFWGSVGTRAATRFSRNFDGAESELVGVHRLRHLVEPSVDLFTAASTVNNGDLPVYDPDVEAIEEGSGVRLGLRNTLQTQRGGPGRWRSVDWIVLDTDVVFRSDDADVDTELARFLSYRPEFSVGGDHFYSRLLWLISDTLGIAGELTHSFEDDRVAQWRLGTTLRHTPRLSSYVDYAELDIITSRLLSYGFAYQLTTKYRLGFGQRLDFAENESRTVNMSLERRLPRWRLKFVASFDEIDDEATVGVVLLPEGMSDSVALGTSNGRP